MDERESMAHLIARITSGLENAEPEQDDYDLADKVLKFIEEELSD